jgi:hypothetical protein
MSNADAWQDRMATWQDHIAEEVAGDWTCSGCHSSEQYVQSYGAGQNAWCEAGLSGAHLEHWLIVGCQAHQQYGPHIRLVGRHCPGDCEWSRSELP